MAYNLPTAFNTLSGQVPYDIAKLRAEMDTYVNPWSSNVSNLVYLVNNKTAIQSVLENDSVGYVYSTDNSTTINTTIADTSYSKIVFNAGTYNNLNGVINITRNDVEINFENGVILKPSPTLFSDTYILTLDGSASRLSNVKITGMPKIDASFVSGTLSGVIRLLFIDDVYMENIYFVNAIGDGNTAISISEATRIDIKNITVEDAGIGITLNNADRVNVRDFKIARAVDNAVRIYNDSTNVNIDNISITMTTTENNPAFELARCQNVDIRNAEVNGKLAELWAWRNTSSTSAEPHGNRNVRFSNTYITAHNASDYIILNNQGMHPQTLAVITTDKSMVHLDRTCMDYVGDFDSRDGNGDKNPYGCIMERHGTIRLGNDKNQMGMINRNYTADRDELQIYTNLDGYGNYVSSGRGDLLSGSSILMYGMQDPQHHSSFTFLTAGYPSGTTTIADSTGTSYEAIDYTAQATLDARMRINGATDDGRVLDGESTASSTHRWTHITIGNGIYNFTDGEEDYGMLNLRGGKWGNPAILFSDIPAEAGELAFSDGTFFDIGHYNTSLGGDLKTTSQVNPFTPRLRIDADGNLKIGDVAGATTGLISAIRSSGTDPNFYSENSTADFAWKAGEHCQFGDWDGTTFNEYVRFTNEGFLEAGCEQTTSFGTGSSGNKLAGFTVGGTLHRALDIYMATTGTGTDVFRVYSDVGGTGNQVAEITGDGTYNKVSDRRAKKNIVDADVECSINDIKNLNWRKYNMVSEDDTEEKHLGIVAQEVLEGNGSDCLKKAVNYREEGDKYLVDYNRLFCNGMVVIKNLLERVEQLEAELNSLKNA